MTEKPFWEEKTLDQLSQQEWESLCDGCARCCLLKLEDEETGELAFTDVVCRYLDSDRCQCTCYQKRKLLVPECLVLTPDQLATEDLSWFPHTCAYRLLSEGKTLPWWHPLVSGNPETVYEAGVSVRYRVISEALIDDIETRIVTWPEGDSV